MSSIYSAFGLRLESSRTIPGLLELPFARGVDVQVWMDKQPPWPNGLLETPSEILYTKPDEEKKGQPLLTVWIIAGGRYFRILYKDGTEFVLDGRATRVWGTWVDPWTFEDAAVYLLGPILGFVLRLRGVACLHASAVAVGGQAIALLGPPGTGKSTTAAALAKLGHAVLSDNVLALVDQGNTFLAQSGYPRLCLWPDSVRLLFGSADALPLLTPNWDKRYLPLKGDGYRFQEAPLPLAVIYVLGDRMTDPAAANVEALSLQEGMLTLVANSYLNYLLDETMRSQEFQLLGRVAANIPVRRVRLHCEPGHLSRLCEVILEDSYTLAASSLAARGA